LGQESPTNLMIEISQISSVAVLLPLVVGAIGALHLSQAANNSLVPGAAVGALVAASLAPPAGLVGMAAAVGRWDLAMNGGFVLLLQLLGINLAGSLVFLYFGLSPEGSRFKRGKRALFYFSLAASLLGIAGMLLWQFSSTPELQRKTQAMQAHEQVQQIIRDYPSVSIVESNVRFTRPAQEDRDILLGVIYVLRESHSNQPTEEIRQELSQIIQQQLAQSFSVTPLISVTVLESP
jgi:uncharacterized membrane protein